MQLFRVFWSGFRLEFFSPDLCLAFFRSGKASQHIYYSVLIIFLPNCYIGRVSLCLFHKLESFFSPSLYWQCGDYQQPFQSGHLSQTHTTMDVLVIRLGQRDNSFSTWHLVSLMYVSVFWNLDDQMRLPHVTCPFDPDYCFTIVFFLLGTYYILLYH